MTKREQVARAIALADGEDYMEDCARYDARAMSAIKAMLNPTAAMIIAAVDEGSKDQCRPAAIRRMDVAILFNAAIIAALREKETDT